MPTLRQGGYVSLEVRDSGTGMDEKTMERIFDPFFTTKVRLRRTGTCCCPRHRAGPQGGNKGLQYARTWDNIQDSLPCNCRPATRARGDGKRSKRRLPDTAVLTGTILVVDDEEMILEMARSILEQSGYTVIMAENGEQAISIFREVADQISAVLLDMTMPVMSGEKTLKLLRAINPDVPVLWSSGFSEIEALERSPGQSRPRLCAKTVHRRSSC